MICTSFVAQILYKMTHLVSKHSARDHLRKQYSLDKEQLGRARFAQACLYIHMIYSVKATVVCLLNDGTKDMPSKYFII